MNRNDEQLNPIEPTRLSPLAQDKTFGEKRFDLIFGNLINFWVNLVTSAGFAFFVKHSTAPLAPLKTLTKGKFDNLRDLQDHWIDGIAESRFVSRKLSESDRKDRAESIMNVVTLLTPGHFVMIPSVWLGEKFKAPIVKYFDRKHYGDEAMNNPDLKARHDAIEIAKKPTFIGTVIARFGAAAVNISLANAIGAENNWVKQGGQKANADFLEKFDGIDKSAENVGHVMAEMAKVAAPKWVARANNTLSTGTDYSRKQQLEAAKKNVALKKPYSSGFDDLARYFVQDIMYTISTAAFIHPIVHLLNKVIPGMTYTPTPKPGVDIAQVKQIKLSHAQFPLSADRAPIGAPEAGGPGTRIHSIESQSTLEKQQDLAATIG